MTKTDAFPEKLVLSANLISTALDVRRANAEYTKQWNVFWQGVKPVTKARFWELLQLFRKEIEVYCFNYGRTNGVEDAAWEFFRKVLTGESKYSEAEAYGFVKAYEKAKHLLDKRLAKLFEFGGDEFDDLMDSLPLVGEEFFGREFSTEAELYSALNGLGPKWKKFIHSENYVEMYLEDAAKKFTLSRCQESDDSSEEEDGDDWL